MILISHRGNLKGGLESRENEPVYINLAMSQGYDVEIDVWFINGEYYLGHDAPQYLIKPTFLKNRRLWCHAKNIEALFEMLKHKVHCFWHQEDDATLTSRGYMWTYPGKKLTSKSICVLPENTDNDNLHMGLIGECFGVCSDYISNYKNNLI
jgi:hypothetical protein